MAHLFKYRSNKTICAKCGYSFKTRDLLDLVLSMPECVPIVDYINPIDGYKESVRDEDRCCCGAHKVNGTKKGQLGHSSWCPWSVSK